MLPAATRPVVPRGVERLAGVVLLLVRLWQLASSVGWLGHQTLAGPIDVWKTRWVLAQGRDVAQRVVGLCSAALVKGLAIGVPIGTFLAVVAGLLRLGEDLVDSPMHMLRFVPIIALSPLIIAVVRDRRDAPRSR